MRAAASVLVSGGLRLCWGVAYQCSSSRCSAGILRAAAAVVLLCGGIACQYSSSRYCGKVLLMSTAVATTSTVLSYCVQVYTAVASGIAYR